jgi:hypothetical protein
MRAGDLRAVLAYGSGLTIAVTLKDNADPPQAINVTGYTARMQVLKYNGSVYGAVVLELLSSGGEITVGGSNGTFTATISDAQSAALATAFGSPPPYEPARMRFFVSPGGDNEQEIAHGTITLREASAAIDPISVDVYEESFSVNVSAVALSGPPGPPGTGSVTAAAVVLTSTSHASAIASTDGAAIAAGAKVLDIAAADATQRGLWINGTPWTRSSDELTPGMTVVIESGDYGKGLWQLNAATPFTLDATAQAWNRVDGTSQRTSVSTASLTGVVIQDVALPRGLSWSLEFDVTIEVAGSRPDRLKYQVSGTTDASGTTTGLAQDLVATNGGELGAVEASAIAGAKLRLTVFAGTATPTTFTLANFFLGVR